VVRDTAEDVRWEFAGEEEVVHGSLKLMARLSE
jgi:hypothetical protein